MAYNGRASTVENEETLYARHNRMKRSRWSGSEAINWCDGRILNPMAMFTSHSMQLHHISGTRNLDRYCPLAMYHVRCSNFQLPSSNGGHVQGLGVHEIAKMARNIMPASASKSVSDIVDRMKFTQAAAVVHPGSLGSKFSL